MKRFLSLVLAIALVCAAAQSVFAEEEERDFMLNLTVDGVNAERGNQTVIVYDRDFGASTGTSGSGSEITVDGSGRVVSITSDSDGDIPENGFVISAGAGAKRRLSGISVGDLVSFNKEFLLITAASDCYDPFKQTVLSYTAINATRAENTLVVYRDRASTGTNTWGYEVTVNSDGTIISVGGNNSAIPQNGFVLSAIGDKKQPLIDAAKLGMTVILNEGEKTATIGYDKDGASEKYALGIDALSAEYRELYSALFDFELFSVDDSAFNKELARLNEFADAAAKAAENGDSLAYAENDFIYELLSGNIRAGLIPNTPVEARTLWLRIPTGSSQKTVQSTVEKIVDLGFNSVCIECMFDNTMIMPLPEDSLFEQNPAFGGEDMLRAYLDEFHKYDVEVHLWASVYRVGYEGSSNTQRSLGAKKPEWRVKSQTGSDIVSNEYGDAYFLNPALPEVRDTLLSTYKYILENYDIDGLQLDYVRYPESTGQIYGYDDYTQSEFLKLGYTSVPTSQSQANFNEWTELRAGYVTELVRSIKSLIDEIRPDVWLSIDVAPASLTELSGTMCQDARNWVKEGIVDIVYPMAYGTTDAVEKWSEQTLELCGDRAYSVIGLRDNGREDYLDQIVVARKLGASGSAFFSYSQYIAGDYAGYIEKTAFSSAAVNPTASAKNAVIAQLEYAKRKLGQYEKMEDHLLSLDIPIYLDTPVRVEHDKNVQNTLTAIEKALSSLKEHTLFESEDALRELLGTLDGDHTDGPIVDGSLRSGLIRLLNETAHTIELAMNASKDDAKTAYLAAHPKDVTTDDSSDYVAESSEAEKNDVGVVNKIFQVLFIGIMTIGIVGLPLYWYLDKRRKLLAQEGEENKNDADPDDGENDQ